MILVLLENKITTSTIRTQTQWYQSLSTVYTIMVENITVYDSDNVPTVDLGLGDFIFPVLKHSLHKRHWFLTIDNSPIP